MQKDRHYIVIDLGATSGRVILSTVSGNGSIGMETVHRFHTPLVERGGKYFWDIGDIFGNIISGLHTVGQRGIAVESIGIDTWGVDFVGIRKDGSLCGDPRSYRDPYSVKAQDDFLKIMPREELYSRTGIQIMNFNSVFQLFAQKRDGDLEDADKILFMPDALSYMLTGNMVCEYTILSTSALMDPRTKELDPGILKVCGLGRDKFPQIVFPGHTVGKLKPALAESTLLGDVAVVSVAGHDTGSAVAAVPSGTENFAYLSSGTWSLMGIETREAVINDRMFKLNYTNEGGVGGTTRLLKNITGMWLLEQCLESWRKDGRSYSYAQVHQMAGECAKSLEVIDPNDPDFSSPQDMPSAIIRKCREKGITAPEDDAHMVRLIYDSLAAKYSEVLGSLREIAPFRIDTLHIIGGGSQNALLNSLTASACGIRVVAGPAECTAMGNLMVQAGLTRDDIMKSVECNIF